MEQRRFCRFRKVLRGLHRLSATFKMRGEFRGSNGRTRCAFAFQRSADVKVKLRTTERSRAFVEHLAEQRMSKRIRRFRHAVFVATWSREPEALVLEFVAGLSDPCDLTPGRVGNGANTKVDAADRGCRQQGALLVA